MVASGQDVRSPDRMMRSPQAPPGRGLLIGFSLGSLGTGIFSITPSVLLLYFMTDILGIAAGLAAIAMAVPRFWDILVDPVVGAVSDRTRSRWGRRRPFLLVGAILMTASFIFLFSVPESLSVEGRFWYVLTIFVISSTAYSVFAVPYVAMPAEMSEVPQERTRIMAYRIGFALAGLLIGATVAPLLVELFGNGRAGYAAMSYTIGGFCGLTMLAVFFVSSRIPLSDAAEAGPSLRNQLGSVLRNRQFLVLLVTYMIQISGISGFLAAVPYFIIYIDGGTAGDAGLVFLALMSAALLSMPLWSWAAIRFGKYACYRATTILYAATSLIFLLFLRDVPAMPVMLAAVLGVSFGSIMMLPFSMLTDTIQLDTMATGLRREGIFTGLWMAGEKAGLAFGPLIVGTILSLTGFAPSTDGVAVSQTGTALWGVQAAFGLVPAGVVLASLVVLHFYSVREVMLVRPSLEN